MKPHILKYKTYYKEANKHLEKLEKAFKKLQDFGYLPLDKKNVQTILENDDLVPILDQIIYRYSKLQETLGKLIRAYLYLKGENVENMPIIDVINMASKYGIELDKEKWFELRELRNMLVHEYEDELFKIANTLNKILQEMNLIKKVVEQMRMDV
ncbi:hypothetical protein, partial [Persephonella sp.]